MDKLIVLIHTVPPLLSVFDRLGGELLPDMVWKHILDEPLLARIEQTGGLTSRDSERLREHVEVADQIGADAVLVTCSTVSPCVDQVRPAFALPILKIDEAMVEEAVSLGQSIGVIATNDTTLKPTRLLLRSQAQRMGKKIQVELMLVDDALTALMHGDGAKHDRLVKRAVLDMMDKVDVIVLAQASMARVLDALKEAECAVPVLSSPHLALERLKNVLRAD